MRDALHGRIPVIELVRRLLPPVRARDDGLAQARAWRERRVSSEIADAAFPCQLCRHHVRFPSTVPLLPHRTASGEMHG